MKKISIILLTCFVSFANAQPSFLPDHGVPLATQVMSANDTSIDKNCPQFAAYGAPHLGKQEKADQYLCRSNYAVAHRCNTKTAWFVLEHLTADSFTGPAQPKGNFRADPEVTEKCRATLGDYKGLPYDWGKMSPDMDNTKTDQMMTESFLLSNMVPQNPSNNRGILARLKSKIRWARLESKIRDYVLEYGEVYVTSGPIYDEGYATIGNHVGVPTRFFKIILDKKRNQATAFILPNEAVPLKDLPSFATTILEVEKATGIDFNPALPAALRNIEETREIMEEWFFSSPSNNQAFARIRFSKALSSFEKELSSFECKYRQSVQPLTNPPPGILRALYSSDSKKAGELSL